MAHKQTKFKDRMPDVSLGESSNQKHSVKQHKNERSSSKKKTTTTGRASYTRKDKDKQSFNKQNNMNVIASFFQKIIAKYRQLPGNIQVIIKHLAMIFTGFLILTFIILFLTRRKEPVVAIIWIVILLLPASWLTAETILHDNSVELKKSIDQQPIKNSIKKRIAEQTSAAIDNTEKLRTKLNTNNSAKNEKNETLAFEDSYLEDNYLLDTFDLPTTNDMNFNLSGPLETAELAYQNKLARTHEREGNIEEAKTIYEFLISKQYNSIFPYERLIRIYRKEKNIPDEVRLLKKTISYCELNRTQENKKKSLKYQTHLQELQQKYDLS